VESFTNQLIGFFIAMLTQMIVFPLYDIHVSHTQNFTMTAIFTVVSMIRSFIIRRYFNGKIVKVNQ
jgi:hypothetical protein